MTNILQRALDYLASDSKRPKPLYRYGMLAFLLALLVAMIPVSQSPYTSSTQRIMGFGIFSLLLLNHLVFAFHWPRRVAIPMRTGVLAYGIGLFAFTVYHLYSAWTS